MPRKGLIDAAGALHHVIARGIDRKKVFDDNADRDFFIERLGLIIGDAGIQCFAWALISNHFHLLLKTGATPIATVMIRLLAGYAMHYNRRHKRYGHLFQNSTFADMGFRKTAKGCAGTESFMLLGD